MKDDNLYKEIISVGSSKIKPTDIDIVVVSSCCYLNNNKDHKIEEYSFNEVEINLDAKDYPAAIRLCLQSMRKDEKSKFFIKPGYLINYYKEYLPKYLEGIDKNDKVIFEVKMHSWFTVKNLMDRSEIRKRILIKSSSKHYPRNPDTVNFNLRCIYKGNEIYNKMNETIELDKDHLFEIEKRILQNVKLLEYSYIIVKPSYMKDKNSEFLKKYNIDNENDLEFYCQINKIEIFDYIYKFEKDPVSKKRLLHSGFGRDSPDRESFVTIKLQIKIDDKIVFNNFDANDLFEYYSKDKDFIDYEEWRDNINKHYGIEEIDADDNYKRDVDIFNEHLLKFPKVLKVDLRSYSLPLVLRKVIIHMKRNELVYIKTNYLDYFNESEEEIKDVKNSKVEIFVHTFEFLHREVFSKLSYEDKFADLNNMKDAANVYFKENKLFRSSKIYQNINYRFNFGDVFGPDMEKKIEKLKESNPELIQKLLTLRLASHNNLASAKFKLNKFNSTYEVTQKVKDNN